MHGLVDIDTHQGYTYNYLQIKTEELFKINM